MLTTDIRKIDFGGKNLLKSHIVNLDDNLDCVILLSIKDPRLGELFYNKIVDALIDRIHPKNVYKDFSNALENINAFLETWKPGGEKIKGLHGVIGIYHKKTFLFSSIGKASCYLYNTNGDIIEVSDKEDTPINFSFISTGDIARGESLILGTIRLLDILSKDDMRDGFSLGNIERAGENIEHILLHEHTGKNIGIFVLHQEIKVDTDEISMKDRCIHYGLKACDNTIVKKGLSYLYHIKKEILLKSQLTRQILLGGALLVSVIFLYSLISSFFNITSNIQNIEEAKNNFYIAQESVLKASENMNNIDMFSLNIETAGNIIKQLESQELFLEDVQVLKANMEILQKQFNGIQPFESTVENTIYSFEAPQHVVKIISISDKIYVVGEKGITGPIIQGQKAQRFVFDNMKDDIFVDATAYDTNIVLVTDGGKVVNFAKNKKFSYIDVTNQATWEDSPIIESYASNIYLLSDAGNQILRHKRQSSSYDAGVAYLNDDDAAAIGNILSLAIDGGIYILKEDGSVVKLFTSKYRLEGIVLNKLPKNYIFDTADGEAIPSIRARGDLNYVYILLKNKIFIFKPNTVRYQDVTSLNYIGQIEGKNIRIDNFYVDNDGELFIASVSGISKLEFDVIDESIVIK